MRTLLSLLTLLIALDGHAIEVRALLPIYLDQPVAGGFGSNWVSEFSIHNPTAVEYLIHSCSPTDALPCILNLLPDEDLLPGETQSGLPGRYPKPAAGVAGGVVYLWSRDEAPVSAVAFQLRVKDLGRNAQSAGTEIPVVRESSFRKTAVRLLTVPVDARFRLLLRVYDMNLDSAEFRVRVFNELTGVKISERTLVASTTRGEQGPRRFEPAYTQLSDVVDPASGATRVRVEVEPLSAGGAFWAFISVTNNVTQEFTLVTPQ